MKITSVFLGLGMANSAIYVSANFLANPRDIPIEDDRVGRAVHHSHTLKKRDAYSCYGNSANASHCQGAVEQIKQFGDQELELYSGVCLNWSKDTCNVRFCSQPFVYHTVNRTASWLYNWANGTLMTCVQNDQYAVMGDSNDLNGKGGTYRVYIEPLSARGPE
ncbi:hypothetical protein GGS20DRAFT_589047 [Poronia punctata]|nr:hypothetical protein GGS20DRAFT_589047 [Poronia punctata]